MRFDSSAKIALVVVLAALAISGVGFRAAIAQLNLYLRKEPVELRGPLATLPATLEGWRQLGEDGVLSAAIVEELGTSQYLNRVYLREGDGRELMMVHLAYYTGFIDAVPHVPQRCSVAAGNVLVEQPRILPLPVETSRWLPSDAPPNRATKRPYLAAETYDPVLRRFDKVHLPVGDFAIQAMEFQDHRHPDRRLIAGYLFIANGRVTPSALDVRSLAFQRTDRYAYYCKVQLEMPCSVSDEHRWQRYQELCAELLGQLLPHLMRRLPDWPEVEAREAADRSDASPAGARAGALPGA